MKDSDMIRNDDLVLELLRLTTDYNEAVDPYTSSAFLLKRKGLLQHKIMVDADLFSANIANGWCKKLHFDEA